MSVETRLRILYVAIVLLAVAALAFAVAAARSGPTDAAIHIDDAPAYACLGEGCP